MFAVIHVWLESLKLIGLSDVEGVGKFRDQKDRIFAITYSYKSMSLIRTLSRLLFGTSSFALGILLQFKNLAVYNPVLKTSLSILQLNT